MRLARTARLFIVAASMLLAPLASHAQLFSANLVAGNEVPPVASTATGSALVGIIDGVVVYNIATQNLNNIILAHIHRGGQGIAGPVVVDFVPTFVAGVARGAVPVLPSLASEIAGNPAGFYVNVHTTQNPGGEIRGQLAPSPATGFAAGLAGINEVPPADPAGVGSASLLIGGTMVAYSIRTTNVANITLSHIHRGAAGVNGPIIIDFAPTFVNGVAQGIVATTAQNVADVIASPGGHYVNVHTTAFPGGAVRGQIAPLATVTAPQGVPTLAEWAMLLLAGLMLAAGARQVLRKH